MPRNCKGTICGEHTSVVHVGAPPDHFREWAQTSIYFHGFADLPKERGKFVWSPNFRSLGYEWAIKLYPGGEDDERVEPGKISIYLLSESETRNIEVHFDFSINVNTNRRSRMCKFNGDGHGFHSFFDRSTTLKHLVKGALLITVRIKPVKHPSPFIPDNPSRRIMQDLFMEEEFADVEFHFGGEKDDSDSTDQMIKASGKKFYAHRLILNKAAPLLAELSSSGESPSRVELPNISPDAFEALLLYIYGREIPKFGEDIELTKEIINAADKYGITNLKLEAEAVYIASIKITCENIMENLQYADSKNCALLKQEVMDFIEENAVELVETGKLKDAPKGIFQDVLAVVARNKKRKRISNEFSTMHISELRREADRKGLDVDGSREMLIAAIKDANEDNNGDDDENDGGKNSNEVGE